MLFLNNDDVANVLQMSDCIDVQERSFRGLVDGASIHRPRIDMYVPCEREDGYWRWGTMEGATSVPGPYFAIRMKSDVITWSKNSADEPAREDKYCVSAGKYCGLIMLFSTRNGEPLAMINDGYLQHMRVGGGAGIGAKYLSRKNATKVGMLGSGGMARSYLEALCHVRNIREVAVYSPNVQHCRAYASEMADRLDIQVTAVPAAEEAVADADIIATCTNSMAPTLELDWLRAGTHLTNLGPFELSEDLLQSADVVIRQGIGGAEARWFDDDRVVSNVGHSPLAYVAGSREEMERLPKSTAQTLFRRDFPDLNELMVSPEIGRTNSEQTTVYINAGNQGLQFAAVGGLVFEAAVEQGIGRELPTEWYLQNIRD